MALKHVPHVQPRNDSLAGPKGRRGDQVFSFWGILKQQYVCLLCSYSGNGHVLPNYSTLSRYGYRSCSISQMAVSSTRQAVSVL